MLVLSRKPDETVELPDLAVSVRVLRCTGTQVQLGIDAPRSIQVLRGELRRDDLRSLPLETVARDALGCLRQLEMQISALAELSAVSDRPLATSVAEDALESLRKVRWQLLRNGDRPVSRHCETQQSMTVSPLEQASCVRHPALDYQIEPPAAIEPLASSA